MASRIYRFRIGAIPCAIVAGGSGELSEQDIQTIFSRDAEAVLALYRSYGTPVISSYNILYIEADGKRILVDTGVGMLDPDDEGNLREGLGLLGVAPESINTVFVTHFHGDHIGGVIDRDGALTFPNATVIVPRVEYEHWMKPDVLAKMSGPRLEHFQKTMKALEGHLQQAEEGTELAHGIRMVAAPGHTPGHTGLLIESEGERLLHIVDTAHTPMQFTLVDVSPAFDAIPDTAVATRRALLERAAAENLLILGYHLTFPGLGHVQRDGAAYRWEPRKQG